ncbi:MAG TPA: NUDIX hydrolase [Solirubrobacteraceae bacterium]|nr:NUDIX hydrolase [Solirubrobacteraceae bacterium]
MSSEPPPPAAGRPRRREPAQPREHSAGGVVVRGEDVLVIVPNRRAADGSVVLGLPKGHIDPGEDALAAAVREVREEAGVEVELVCELGEVRYWYSRAGRAVPKGVHFFLFRYAGGDPADHDEEVQEARWMPLAQACEQLTYEGEREILGRALAALDR